MLTFNSLHALASVHSLLSLTARSTQTIAHTINTHHDMLDMLYSIPTKVGRTDDTPKSYRPTPDGRLPDAAQGAQHVRDVFARMGFNEREMVALIGGGHALGRCHTDRSGFEVSGLKLKSAHFGRENETRRFCTHVIHTCTHTST
jgi:hypothetical protein